MSCLPPAPSSRPSRFDDTHRAARRLALQLAHDPALPNADVAAEQKDAPFSGRRPVESIDDGAERCLAADEDRADEGRSDHAVYAGNRRAEVTSPGRERPAAAPALAARDGLRQLRTMIGSAVVYCGLLLALVGLILIMKPFGVAIVGAGLALATIGALLPAPESRVSPARTRLDEFAPAWQFRERHSTTVAAPPARVFEAIRSVRADEIRLFRTLTWIRRRGRRLPESILNAGDSTPIIDVALRTSFVRLADDPPRELVVATTIGTRPRHSQATMNFLVRPNRDGGSIVSTETRVFAKTDAARRRFAVYWRVIYPGSALIRRMWLRAIKRRAEGLGP